MNTAPAASGFLRVGTGTVHPILSAGLVPENLVPALIRTAPLSRTTALQEDPGPACRR
jgi:hypothetical protein